MSKSQQYRRLRPWHRRGGRSASLAYAEALPPIERNVGIFQAGTTVAPSRCSATEILSVAAAECPRTDGPVAAGIPTKERQ